jgi:cyclase
MRISFIALALALAASPAAAQHDVSKVEVKVERIAPGIAVLFGAGGNIGLSHGEDGNVIIDDQYAPMTDKIVAAVASVDPDPLRFVINTHWHGDHTGGNENLGKRGTVIVAHDNVRKRMSTEQFLSIFNERVPPSPKGALPVITFADGVNFHLNGDTMRVVHIANAHTDGDSVVFWERSNVVHLGDLFFHRFSFPFVDRDSGGSLAGLIAAIDKLLPMIRPDTKIIPGHGAVATRQDLIAYRAMLVDIRDKVVAGIKRGQTLAQIVASKPAAPYGMPEGFIKPDAFVTMVYESLREAPHQHGAQSHQH